MAILTDNKNNTIIDSDRIISNNDKGIVVTNKKSWHFIPKQNITEQEEYKDGYYYNQEDNTTLKSSTRTEEYILKENPIDTDYIEKSRYMFGFKNLKFANVKYDYTAGIISDYIDLDQYNYITISDSNELSLDYSIEYSILDGSLEIPILPEDQTKTFEKLFYNIDPRFVLIDTPVLYQYDKNSKTLTEIERNYTELSFDDFSNYDYYIEYTPGGETHKYIPENNNIRIKIIYRNLTDNNLYISSVVLKKYGGGPDWI